MSDDVSDTVIGCSYCKDYKRRIEALEITAKEDDRIDKEERKEMWDAIKEKLDTKYALRIGIFVIALMLTFIGYINVKQIGLTKDLNINVTSITTSFGESIIGVKDTFRESIIGVKDSFRENVQEVKDAVVDVNNRVGIFIVKQNARDLRMNEKIEELEEDLIP